MPNEVVIDGNSLRIEDVVALTHEVDEVATHKDVAAFLVWTADPNLVRRLEVGQACYIQRGAATFVHIARPRPSPLTLLPPPAQPPSAPVPGPGPQRDPAPDPWPSPGGLDDFFDPGDPR